MSERLTSRDEIGQLKYWGHTFTGEYFYDEEVPMGELAFDIAQELEKAENRIDELEAENEKLKNRLNGTETIC